MRKLLGKNDGCLITAMLLVGLSVAGSYAVAADMLPSPSHVWGEIAEPEADGAAVLIFNTAPDGFLKPSLRITGHNGALSGRAPHDQAHRQFSTFSEYLRTNGLYFTLPPPTSRCSESDPVCKNDA